MPQQTYMGVDVRRDHSFRIPDPIASVQLGVPNACTQCHKDRDDRWAAEFITRRTGRTAPRYKHAGLLTAARKGDASVAPDLLAYARDDGNPAILRSIVLLESARFPSSQQLDAVSASLASPDPLIRLGGVSALERLDDLNERLSRLQPVLADPAKSVRMAAARDLVGVPVSQVEPGVRPALGKLFDEYRASLLHNADMPESMSDLGIFLAAQGDLDAAENALLKARKLSPRYLPAMLNLADVYRAQSRDDMGEQLLREALAQYPKSAEVHHMLGLLYVRTGRTQESVALLREASALAPGNAQFALVYAVALVETGESAAGIKVLQAAARRFPDNEVITNALAEYRARYRN